MQLLDVNQLLSALERKIDKIKGFAFILSFCHQVYCSIEKYSRIAFINFYTNGFVIKDCLA